MVILWPPVADLFDEIQSKIGEQYTVENQVTYKFTKEGFKDFVNGIYKPDKTPTARIKRKYKVMAKHKAKVRTFYAVVENPNILPHKKTRLKGQTFCKDMKDLKHVIREAYKDGVKRYTHDVIIHISDNNGHNKRTKKLLKKHGQE